MRKQVVQSMNSFGVLCWIAKNFKLKYQAKKIVCSLMFIMGCTFAYTQDQTFSLKLDRVSIGIEIGQTNLGLSALNREAVSLGFLPIEPGCSSFAFQFALANQKYIEPYLTVILLSSYQYDEVFANQGFLLSSYLGATSVGFGLRSNFLSLFNNRFQVVGDLGIQRLFYRIEFTWADNVNPTAGQLAVSSQDLLAHSQNIGLQPGMEFIYNLLNKRNLFGIGLKVGYLYHVFKSDWTNRYGVAISDLSPVINENNFAFSLKLIYTIDVSDF